ncbi:hypothetical protein [Bradyrhizobium sp. LA7.1]|uniref:hypothetical protein n=1 Tax=Bradyrhizobium sp. LA7.1 TaxID=3156324 RepID=UPI003396E0CB
MPARMKRDKRRRSAHLTTEAVALFRRGLTISDPYELRDLKIALAAALGRSKFSASPLDLEPRSLIGCDREHVEVVLALRAQIMRIISKEVFK